MRIKWLRKNESLQSTSNWLIRVRKFLKTILRVLGNLRNSDCTLPWLKMEKNILLISITMKNLWTILRIVASINWINWNQRWQVWTVSSKVTSLSWMIASLPLTKMIQVQDIMELISLKFFRQRCRMNWLKIESLLSSQCCIRSTLILNNTMDIWTLSIRMIQMLQRFRKLINTFQDSVLYRAKQLFTRSYFQTWKNMCGKLTHWLQTYST